MKWRNTAIYFLVLLLIGGIYLVMEQKQKEAARGGKGIQACFHLRRSVS